MSEIGHNSGISSARLESFLQRVERLNEEKKVLSEDIKEVFSEAKSAGFDVKIMREVLKLRAMDESDRQERQAMIDLYLTAVGDLADTPLGQAGIAKIA